MKKLIKKSFPETYLLIRSLYRYFLAQYYKLRREESYPIILAKLYKRNTGKDLNWNHIETYSEKMQWSKLYEQDDIKTILSDKYLVRDWVKNTIGEQYLIPLLGVWDTFEEIEFEKLPQQFVLKANHGSGTNIIVKNKSDLNLKRSKKLFNIWLNTNFAFTSGFELQYKDIKPKIIVEKYIVDQHNELKDYKFICFNGKVYYCWVHLDKEKEYKRNIYDTEWNLQEFRIDDFPRSNKKIEPPKNFDRMVEVAETLCKGFSHVRVDLYNCDGKIYFGEMTFTSGSGYRNIYPEIYDKHLGELW
ncbi:ATP-grasp fold amidoligase family protein [Salinicoccus halitifaciens]|uniref:Glycosyltransferase n=1 Tax=Salinicoccus halitifaciens TaxID=1073415 RepID=A0ABV2EC83_9STAP|nr:ATP-grasp fold amidoligase family protein [Salinicoccus halitifaciens]MCD2138786.1 glycosyl transferase [Salinicoccus halitifaciens]